MRSLLSCLILLFYFSSNAQQYTEFSLPKVAEQINYMYDKYESFQISKNNAANEYGVGSQRSEVVDERIKDFMEINAVSAKKIFDKHGFPDFNKVGKEASHKFFKLVLTMDEHPLFQEDVVWEMDSLQQIDLVSKADFAFLSDRILINKTGKQHFGTQLKYDFDKKEYLPYPIHDKERVNERRQAYQLSPLEDFITEINLKYEGQIHAPKPKVKVYSEEGI